MKRTRVQANNSARVSKRSFHQDLISSAAGLSGSFARRSRNAGVLDAGATRDTSGSDRCAQARMSSNDIEPIVESWFASPAHFNRRGFR
jgi:hypothetical protein